MKLGIIRCHQTEDFCPGNGCLNAVRNKKGVFEGTGWKSYATLTLLAKQDLPTFGYNMIDPLKSWCWGLILFYPFKISRFS